VVVILGLPGIPLSIIMEEVEYWQLDKIELMLELCPYDEGMKQEIMNNLPETKEQADELLKQLWFDHIPRDPRDQFNKMMSMNTLVKQDYKFSYICNDCGDDFITSNKETLCTQCLSPNIKETNES
tara:strand:+ start:1387 stop:1764 length:378 start_codon:yes stop_codon:yes gene_type:complete